MSVRQLVFRADSNLCSVEARRPDSKHEFSAKDLFLWMWMFLCAAVSPGLLRPQDKTHEEKHVKTQHRHLFVVEVPDKKRRRQQRQLRRSPKMIDEHHTSQHMSTVTWQATSPGSTPRAPTRRRNNLEKDFENDLDKNSVTTQTRSNLTDSAQRASPPTMLNTSVKTPMRRPLTNLQRRR